MLTRKVNGGIAGGTFVSMDHETLYLFVPEMKVASLTTTAYE